MDQGADEPLKDYEVVEVPSRGKMVLATRDLLPGTDVIVEAPVMFISQEYADQYQGDSVTKMILAGYSIYNKFLTPENKRRFDALFGPVTGPHAEPYHELATHKLYSLAPDGYTYKGLSPQEHDTFVRVASTIGFNVFEVLDGGYVITDNITRMSHSCLPNCLVDTSATRSTCRTVLPIKKGQELTVEYVPNHRLKPTHFRRHRYLERKNFTCHCPRCSADADDTREFDCFDPKCPGSCFACQPLNREPFLHNISLSYTGVEFVEPHLLPCTVCHRAPPLKYQEDMFALEKNLEKECEELGQICTSVCKCPDISVLRQSLRRIDALTLPRHHSTSVDVLRLRYNFACVRYSTNESKNMIDAADQPPLVEAYARALVRALEHQSKFPNAFHAEYVVDTAFSPGFCPRYSKAFALECCQKALRMLLILQGRDCDERRKYNDKMVELLPQLPPQPATTAQCMFCGESPLRAAFTLMKCSRCKQVAYCSAGCQKAHWPIHKKGCKKA